MECICNIWNPNGLLAIFATVLRIIYSWRGMGKSAHSHSILHAWIESNQPYENSNGKFIYTDWNIQIERNSCRNVGFTTDLCIIYANHTVTISDFFAWLFPHFWCSVSVWNRFSLYLLKLTKYSHWESNHSLWNAKTFQKRQSKLVARLWNRWMARWTR